MSPVRAGARGRDHQARHHQPVRRRHGPRSAEDEGSEGRRRSLMPQTSLRPSAATRPSTSTRAPRRPSTSCASSRAVGGHGRARRPVRRSRSGSGDRLIDQARADQRGEWVLVPAEPLTRGVQELRLSARLDDRPAVESRRCSWSQYLTRRRPNPRCASRTTCCRGRCRGPGGRGVRGGAAAGRPE